MMMIVVVAVTVVVMIWLIHHCVEKNEVNQDSQDI
jgi:hypothetical protein